MLNSFQTNVANLVDNCLNERGFAVGRVESESIASFVDRKFYSFEEFEEMRGIERVNWAKREKRENRGTIVRWYTQKEIRLNRQRVQCFVCKYARKNDIIRSTYTVLSVFHEYESARRNMIETILRYDYWDWFKGSEGCRYCFQKNGDIRIHVWKELKEGEEIALYWP